MFCENCGAEVKTGARFCESCGTPLSVAEPESPVQAPPAQEPPAQRVSVSPNDTVIPPLSGAPVQPNSVSHQSGSYPSNSAYQQNGSYQSNSAYQQSGSYQPKSAYQQNPAYGSNGYANAPFGTQRPPEKVGFVDAIKDFFARYADFKGRTCRSGYWWVVLANFIIGGVLGAIGETVPALSFLNGLYVLAIIIPSIALAVRRLHDVGKKGTYYWMILIPLVGGILLLVQYVKESAGDNEWGLAPESRKDFPPQI